MATKAKLLGSGYATGDDIVKMNCGIITGYPSIVTAPSNHPISSYTVAPAPQYMVTLSATASSPTTLTFNSGGGNNLGTKILSFFIYSTKQDFTQGDTYIIYLWGNAIGDNFLVSSVNPAITTKNPGTTISTTDTGFVNVYYDLPANKSYSVGYSYSGSKIYDGLQLSYSGTNGNLTLTVQHDIAGNGSYDGIFDENNAYIGVFRVVDES